MEVQHYLTLGLVNDITIRSPQRIILGGGVMEQRHLFPLIRRQVVDLLNGFVQAPEILEQSNQYVVPPGPGSRAGVSGALALAQEAESQTSIPLTR